MRNVLMILYYFPPLGSIGTLRSLGHVKHLPDFGWRPFVLTVAKGAAADPKDSTLLEGIPENAKITRTQFFDMNRLVHYCLSIPLRSVADYLSKFWAGLPPDRHLGWLPFAYRQALEIIAGEKVDAIYTSATPYTAHVVGYMLKRATGLPWVAHFGDEWTRNPFCLPRWRWQNRVDSWLEERVLETADHIAVAWPGMSELLSPNMRDKTTTIPSGFDKDDFKEPILSHRNKFRITYTGSFYAAQHPGNFLSAMRELLEEGRIPVEEVELVFVGRTRRAGFVNCEGTILDKVTRHVGFVSHKEAVRYLRGTDVLLLIVSPERGKENIPGKTFEYLASGKPVLALVPQDGATASLVRETRVGAVMAPGDIEAIGEAVLSLYTEWKSGTLRVEPDWNAISPYETRAVTERLAGVLEKVSA